MADFGSLSSLGLGSGVLTSNVIDKLKNADENIMIKPIQEKLVYKQKQEIAANQFQSIFNNVQNLVDTFAKGLITTQTNVETNGTSASLNVNKGIKPQNLSINVKQLAQNDIYQSKGFSSLDDSISDNDTSIKLTIGNNTETTLNIKKGTTLEELKQLINNKNIGITAKILNTGDDSNPYKLILKGNDTGKDNIIKFDYGNIKDLGFNNINYQSAKYDSDSDKVNNSGDTQKFKITVNGTDYTMDVADGTTVKDFINNINNGDLKDSNGNNLSGIVANYDNNTGKINFHLQDIGNITVTDTGLTTDFNSNTDFDNTNKLQKAENSIFNYDGVEITRSNNQISDLITGIKINLKSTGNTTFNIKYDTGNTVKKIQEFIANYNKLISNLQNLTDYNKDKGTIGLFNNNQTFKNIEQTLYKSIFGDSTDSTTVGLSYNRTGHLDFDTSKLVEQFNKNPDKTNQLIENIFDRLNNTMKNIEVNLKLETNNLNNQEKQLKAREESLNQLLNTKYNSMSEQFQEYDSLISSFNNQSAVLQQLIEQSLKSK